MEMTSWSCKPIPQINEQIVEEIPTVVSDNEVEYVQPIEINELVDVGL